MRGARLVVTMMLLGLLAGGCEIWRDLFNTTEEEALEATRLVLNAMVHTAAFVTAGIDPVSGNIYGAVPDSTFAYDYDFVEDHVRQVLTSYRPPSSEYSISGALTLDGIWPGEGYSFDIRTDGDLTLSGGPVSTLSIDLELYSEDGDARTASFHGMVCADGRDFNNVEDYDLVELLIANADVLYEVFYLLTE